MLMSWLEWALAGAAVVVLIGLIAALAWAILWARSMRGFDDN